MAVAVAVVAVAFTFTFMFMDGTFAYLVRQLLGLCSVFKEKLAWLPEQLLCTAS